MWHRACVALVRAASVGCFLVAAAAATGAASAADPTSCVSPTEAPYSMSLASLTGPGGAELALHVDAPTGCTTVETLQHVQLKVFNGDGSLDDVTNLRDVPSPGGTATLELGPVPRSRRVAVQVLVQTGTPGRTEVLRAETTTRLRPDLVIEAVYAPPQTLTTRPVDVSVTIAERGGDSDATATVSLEWDEPTGLQQQVTVPAGGRSTVTWENVALTLAVPTRVSAAIGNAAPAETDATNNARRDDRRRDASTNSRGSNVLVPSLGGYGAQFNQHVYAPITNLPRRGSPTSRRR